MLTHCRLTENSKLLKSLLLEKIKPKTSNFVTVSFKEHESTHEARLEYQSIVIDAHRGRPLSENSGNTCIIEQLRGTCVMPRLMAFLFRVV